MAKLTEIRLRETPIGFPAQYVNADGYVYFDGVPELSLSKAIGEQSDISGVKGEGVLAFSLPKTGKNLSILEQFKGFSIVNNTFQSLDVELFIHSHNRPEDLMVILSRDDAAKTFEVNVIKSEVYWIDAAKEYQICNIDFEDVRHIIDPTPPNHYTERFNNAVCVRSDFSVISGVYVDGVHSDPNHVPFRYPDVNYGAWRQDGAAVYSSYEDLRPWVSLYYTLKEGFKNLGWELTNNVLDNDWGRSLYIYVLKKNLGGFEDNLHWFRGRVHSDLGFIYNVEGAFYPFDFEVTDYDPGSNITLPIVAPGLPGSTYTNNQYNITSNIVCLTFTFSMQVTNNHADKVLFNIYKDTSTTNEIVSVEIDPGATYTINHSYQNKEFAPTDSVWFSFRCYNVPNPGTGVNVSIAASPQSSLTISSCEEKIFYSDYYQIADLVDCKHMLFDVFKGFMELGDFKYEVDYNFKKITIYPPYDTDVWGDIVEGFYKSQDSAIDLTDKILSGSAKVDYPEKGQPRNLLFKFKDSSDAYIDSLGLGDDQFTLNHVVDLGVGVSGEYEVVENSFFEPTLNIDIDGIGPTTGEVNVISMPACWDNTDGNVSYNIKPRIIYIKGNGSLVQLSNSTDPTDYFFFDNSTNSFLSVHKYLISSQQPFPHYFSNFLAPGPTVPETFDENVSYSGGVQNLYNVFYEDQVSQFINMPSVEFLVLMTYNEYLKTTFRDRYFINYKGEPVVWVAAQIRDFKTDKEDPFPTPMKFIPEPQQIF